jgi:alpha-methylacyl-CoA racemase
MAGHDINYIALSGTLSCFGRKGERPLPPVNLLGDFAGGGMLCALGIALALFERSRSGKGQVIDAAMVDGAANLATFLFGFRTAGLWSDDRGTNLLDTGAPFYDTYETADGKHVSVGAIEPQFYAKLLEGLGIDGSKLPHQFDRAAWPQTAARFAAAFKTRTRDEWAKVFDGTDACVAPILTLGEAPSHPHNRARETFIEGVGGVVPRPAPRLSRTPGEAGRAAPLPGEHTEIVLRDAGIAASEIERLVREGAVG